MAGATGLVGSELLRRLAADGWPEVRALVRRALPPAAAAGPIREVRADFERLDALGDALAVTHVFCALGTTIRAAGSREAFRRVDLDYPLALARLARARGAGHFLLVSAAGADSRSRFFYSRVKGELEEALRGVGFPSLTIARPSLLLGDRDDRRLAEELAKLVGWLAPPAWRPVHATQVAAALAVAAREDRPGVRMIGNRELGRAA